MINPNKSIPLTTPYHSDLQEFVRKLEEKAVELGGKASDIRVESKWIDDDDITAYTFSISVPKTPKEIEKAKIVDGRNKRWALG